MGVWDQKMKSDFNDTCFVSLIFTHRKFPHYTELKKSTWLFLHYPIIGYNIFAEVYCKIMHSWWCQAQSMTSTNQWPLWFLVSHILELKVRNKSCIGVWLIVRTNFKLISASSSFGILHLSHDLSTLISIIPKTCEPSTNLLYYIFIYPSHTRLSLNCYSWTTQ